ncbi:hypothetical protein [Cellulomonas sp.]|uniref:hypothetical protein n=1 Tax=Cellulomonas sp. TaxID=40001 RepID=UPI001AFCD12B|nr:hypothetical protein [Cellulomonas sp.]MBO9556886.1 hypothetical protein [Cellulomonas sp.]
MYELNATSTGALAATGAGILQGWVAAWTLLVAGLALLTVTRVARLRLEDCRGGTAGLATPGAPRHARAARRTGRS